MTQIISETNLKRTTMDYMKPFKITNGIIFKLDESVNFKEKFFIVVIFMVGLFTIGYHVFNYIAESYKYRGFEWMILVAFLGILFYDVRREEFLCNLYRRPKHI